MTQIKIPTSPEYLQIMSEFSSIFREICDPNDFDNILVFSSLFNKQFRLQDFTNLALDFRNLRDEGYAFAFPSFTYSSRRNEKFDNSTTRPDPQNGALSRVIFELELFNYRTLDPDYSYLFLSSINNMENVESNSIRSSFGLSSYHEKLLGPKSGILLLGPVLETGLTPVLHLEAIANVPWRKWIETNYYSIASKSTKSHAYYAKIPDYPKERLPKRITLLPLISSLSKTKQTLIKSKSLAVTLFDWSEFTQEFQIEIKKNIFFQSNSHEGRTNA